MILKGASGALFCCHNLPFGRWPRYARFCVRWLHYRQRIPLHRTHAADLLAKSNNFLTCSKEELLLFAQYFKWMYFNFGLQFVQKYYSKHPNAKRIHYLDDVFNAIIVIITPIFLVVFGVFDFTFLTAPEQYYNYIPKIKRDIEFITENYSEIEAIKFANFYVNSFFIVHLVLFASLIARLTFWLRKPYGYNSGVFFAQKVWAGIVAISVTAFLVWFAPSFFREADQISTTGFPPGLMALIITSFFQSAYAFVIYTSVVLVVAQLKTLIFGDQNG